MLKVEQKTPNSICVSGGRGFVRVVEVSPGVIHVLVYGRQSEDVMPHIASTLDAFAQRNGKFYFLADGGRMNSYAPSFRAGWTEWLKAHKSSIIEAHVLVSSRMAKMAISVVNLAVGGMLEAYHDSNKFYEKVQQLAPAARVDDLTRTA